MNKAFTTVRKLNRLAAVLAVLIAGFLGAEKAAAQNYQHTKDKVDQTLRSNARINPSTLAMELSIPIADLPGRGGASMPLVFNYSSKVWELRPTGVTFGPPNYPVEVRPTYSSRAAAGWTSSYAVPAIDSATELYDCNGNATNLLSELPAGCGQYYYAKKIRVILPGGTTHELRKDDGIYATMTGAADKTGIYYAVDGSRARLEWGANGTSTLFLPDGGRYLINAQEQGYRYIDRHGNKLEYNQTSQAWTDTLGRTLAAPITNSTEGTQSFYVPGIGTSPREYKLVWKKLSASGVLAAGYTLAYDAGNCTDPLDTRSPRLFENTHAFKACGQTAGYFDPVVLTEIILPNNQKYKFSYNHYGEIVRIDYPTGGYEKFVYGQIRAISWDYAGDQFVAESYAQSNRGVIDRYVGADDGTAEQDWHYSANGGTTGDGQAAYLVATTKPDDTIEKRFLHLPRSRPTGSQIGNYGYDTALVGMEKETQMLDGNGVNAVMRSRKLFEWEVTSAVSPAGFDTPERNVRLRRQISIIFEPNSTNALATMEETVYETPGQNNVPTDAGYFAALNAKQTKNYHYVALSAADARNWTISQIAALFTNSNLATISEVDYLYDSNHKDRGIIGTVKDTRVIDPSTNQMKAKSHVDYDEAAYLEPATTVTNAPGWENPNTNYRGLPTTTQVWKDTDNSWITTHTLYDQFGNMRKAWDGKGNYSEIQYTDNYSDEVNRNSHAMPTKTISSSNGNGTGILFETSVQYNFNTGLPVSTKDVNNQTTTIEYNDSLLRPTKTIAANGHQSITEYGAGTNVATRYVKTRTQIDAEKWKEGYSWFDGLGRAVKSQSVDSSGDVFVVTEYDIMGRVKKATNPYRANETVYWTENFYDAMGRLSKVKSPDNAEVTTAYGLSTDTGTLLGTVVTVTDQASKQRRSVTNALGQLKRVDEPNDQGQLDAGGAAAQPTVYSYDILNNLTTVNQGQQTRSFAYDSLSRLKTASNPESGTINYIYDNNGNLTTKTDARGVATTYGYDALNRVISKSYTAPTGLTNYEASQPVTYTYDNLPNAKGKLIKVSSTVSTTEYTSFDTMGRVTGHRQTTDGNNYTTAYGYNLSGGLVEQTYPSTRVVKNVLDNDGDLSMVQSKKNANAGHWTYANSFSYTAAGAVSSMQFGNGKWESAVFNSRLQPTQIALGTVNNGTDKLKLNFTYNTPNVADNNGNVLSQTITVPTETINGTTYNGFTATQTYTYDSLNRIKDAVEMIGTTQQWKQTFLYDRYGNRRFDAANTTTISGCAENICNPTIDVSNNRFTTGQGYTYDFAGNLVSDAQSKSFVYDGENKQTKVTSGGITIGEYFYDGDGKRVKKLATENGQLQTTIFIYDASGKMVAEYSTNPLPSATAKVSYLTSDHLGSPRINTDADGRVTSRHDYQPFGEEVGRISYSADTVRNQFTAYERDGETGLDFAQARYYGKSLGRFNSVDPMGFKKEFLNNPQNMNRYIYTRNSPLTYVDANGQCSVPAGLQKGQVGICIEAFIASSRIGGIGHGDGRNFNANDPSLTARMRIILIVSATETAIDVKVQEALISPSRVGTTGIITTGGGPVITADLGVDLPASGSVGYSNIQTNVPSGTEGFGTSTTLDVSLSNGANGAQTLGKDLQQSDFRAVKQVGEIVESASPPGTIDLNTTIKISGSGTNINVSAPNRESRPFPSYAGYAYTVGADGNVVTHRLFQRPETVPADLPKPMTNIP